MLARWRLLLLLLLSVSGAAGCIGWHSGGAGAANRTRTVQTATQPAERIPMAVTASYTLTGELLFDMARRAEENLFTGLAEETLDGSGYFRPTSPAAQPRFSLIIDIRVQRNSRVLLAMFSTLTLNLFPYWSGDDLLFVAVLRDAERRVEGERRIKGRVGYMAWLPLLVAMPFVSSSRGATSDLYREVLTDVVAWSHDVIQGREQPRGSATVAQVPGSAHR